MILYLLFIIFGRKVRDKDYGPSYPFHCPRCDNGVYYHAYKWRSWFHIFWIPLIPWFSHKELVCPICQAGIELDRSEFKGAKALVDDTQQYRERRMSEEQYARKVHDFEVDSSFIDEPIDLGEFEATEPDTEEIEEIPEKDEAETRGFQ